MSLFEWFDWVFTVETSRWPLGVLVALILALAIGLALYLALCIGKRVVSIFRKLWRRYQFWLVFGVSSSYKKQNQQKVDKELRDRATWVKITFDQQTKAIQSNMIEEVQETLKNVIDRRKEAFWFAHTLAKEARYVVEPNLPDYFPKSESK